MTTRLQAAEQIVTALEDTYTCSIWEKSGLVRVYLEEVTYKSKGRVNRRDNGYLSINSDGSIDTDHIERQAGTIAGLIADLNLTIEPVAVQPREPVANDRLTTKLYRVHLEDLPAAK